MTRGPCGFVVALALTSGCAASSPAPQPPPAAATRTEAPRPVAEPVRRETHDLTVDERLGGHTLARHVGRTDAELAERLRREREISAASTYTDADTASVVVATALRESKAKVDAWLARNGSRPNLVLRVVMATGPPIGRSLSRGARTPEPCKRALVVLRWDERRQVSYVLTSYPEADR